PNTPIAQTPNTPTSTLPRITPRISAQFTTGPGTGYQSAFSSLQAFIPLSQTPGQNITFTQTHLNIATPSGQLGGNLLLGYRHHLPQPNLILGGYLSYDIRNTGNNTFHQLGSGLEILADPWEIHLNGYLPLGDTHQLSSETLTTQSTTLSNPRFLGNRLKLTQQTQTLRNRTYESALSGMDIEAGTQLIAWEGGNLKGFLGSYLYSGSNIPTFAGFRSRLVAHPTRNLNLGISLQTDTQFGTNLTFTLGASWGGSPSGERTPQQESLLTRLANPVLRQDNIAIQQQRQSDILIASSEIDALNPATGQPFFIRFVNLNGTAGSGTIESPLNSIIDALNGIPSDSNQIVYVIGTGSSTGFTIPSSVQVLSSGPVQTINTPFGTVQLPNSGSGNIPTINGTVTLNANSVLNGFNVVTGLSVAPGGGIILDGLSGNFEVKNSTITVTNPGASGISCSDITGVANLDISGTTINVNNTDGNGIRCTNVSGTVGISAPTQAATITTNNTQAGIFLQNNSGTVSLSDLNITANGGRILEATTTGNTTISNSTLASNNSASEGILIDGVSGTLGISNTGINLTMPTSNGISLNNITGGVNIAANTGSTISNAGAAGILLQNSATGSIALSNFQITNPTGEGVLGSNVNNLTLQSLNISDATDGVSLSNATGAISLENSQISNSTSRGFFLANTTGTVSSLNLTNNTLTNSNFDAVRIDLSGTAVVTNATFSGNTITGVTAADGDGIDIEAINNSSINATLNNNQISNAGNSGIELEVQNSSTFNSTLSNNTIDNSGGDGVVFLHNSDQNLTMTANNNTISNSGTAGTGIAGPVTPTFGGNGGFGIAVLTLNNGNLQLIIENNTVTNSQDSKIGIAANPSNVNPAFAGSSRIDTRIRMNQMTGTGGTNGAGFAMQTDSDSIACLQIENNTSPTTPGFFLARGGINNDLQIQGNPTQNAQTNVQNNNMGTATTFNVTVVAACP
ncbi:right-handed parallel beta-helix repeat-containing protein, partial [Lusitaniella coriacea LEGE 07157]